MEIMESKVIELDDETIFNADKIFINVIGRIGHKVGSKQRLFPDKDELKKQLKMEKEMENNKQATTANKDHKTMAI